MDAKSTNWAQDGETSAATVPLPPEGMPSLAPGMVAGLVLAVLLAIVVLFTLGIMLDCRQKKILDKKVKRPRFRRRAADVESDAVGIAGYMEPAGLTAARAVPAAIAAAAPAP